MQESHNTKCPMTTLVGFILLSCTQVILLKRLQDTYKILSTQQHQLQQILLSARTCRDLDDLPTDSENESTTNINTVLEPPAIDDTEIEEDLKEEGHSTILPEEDTGDIEDIVDTDDVIADVIASVIKHALS